MLAGNRDVARNTVLVDGRDVESRGPRRMRENRSVSHVDSHQPPMYDISIRDSRGVAAVRISE